MFGSCPFDDIEKNLPMKQTSFFSRKERELLCNFIVEAVTRTDCPQGETVLQKGIYGIVFGFGSWNLA